MHKSRVLNRRVVTALGCSGLLWAVSALAATQYVSDQLSINMRSGAGTQYKIEKLLNAGDELQTLSQASGWTRVRTQAGQTGYVLTRFLSDQPTASVQLSSAQQHNTVLSQQNDALKAQLSQALNGSNQLGELKHNLVQENQSLKAQLQKIRETSADAIRIGNENEKYREQIIQLRSNVDRLKHENESLQSRREGMQIGALILFGGILIGLVLPLLRRRQKGSWDSL